MRTIIETIVDSALQQLAFSKSTLSCFCSRLRSWVTASFHLGGNQSKLSLGHADCSVISESITFGLFPTYEERFNAHRTVTAQRFSSIHF